MKYLNHITLALIILCLFNCDTLNHTEESYKWEPWPAPSPDLLELSVQLSPENVERNSTLEMILTIHNPNDTPVDLIVSGSGDDKYNYDFAITALDSTYIWNRLGVTITTGDLPLTIAEGDSREFSYHLDLGQNGNQLDPGDDTYLVWGGLRSVLKYESDSGTYESLGDIGTSPDTLRIE